MKEFFGIGGYQRTPEGFLSWQHILFVSCFMVAMVALAIYFGRKFRDRSEEEKNKVLLLTAIILDTSEVFRIIMACITSEDPMRWLYELPLFLCGIPLILIPLAALSKGRVREASLDFVLIFGILGAVLGTYGAGQNYNAYPVLSFNNVISAVTHTISGFASLYIVISGMDSMKKKNIWISFCILFGFCAMAFTANSLLDYNYMFLVRGDGTPYDIFYNLVGGNPVLYPMTVILLFLLYIAAFYGVYHLVKRKELKCDDPEQN
ncbi:MAG: YwaF family protein [Clostridia bacterium]|nr:YwaF family protein [Clostridia bacterium]